MKYHIIIVIFTYPENTVCYFTGSNKTENSQDAGAGGDRFCGHVAAFEHVSHDHGFSHLSGYDSTFSVVHAI